MKSPSLSGGSHRKRCSLSWLMRVIAIASCLCTSHGFAQPAARRSRAFVKSPGANANDPTMTSPSYSSIGCTGKKPMSLMAHERIIEDGASCYKNRSGICESSLFPRRTIASSRQLSVLMATSDSDDSSNEVTDEDNSPLVKVWLSFRKLLARLWAIFLKPFRLLKSLLEKNKDETAEETKDEKPEEVAITEVENIAAVEEEEEEVKDVVSEVVAKEEETEAATSEADVAAAASLPAEAEAETKPTVTAATTTIPSGLGPRAATTASVDLTGNWTLIVDESFASQYENYLRKLGQPMLVRTVALTVIGSTKEETVQSDDGRSLFIRGSNVRGSWDRTLEASEQTSGSDVTAPADEDHPAMVHGHELTPMTTADGEAVATASWWEDDGTVHRSWVVGGGRYGGGDFENRRYLTDGGNILVCESTFHPRGETEGREDARVDWRFLREGAIYGDAAPAAMEFPNIFDVLKKEDEDDGEEEQESPGVIVGDIMDEVAIAAEDENAERSPAPESSMSMTDMLEEQIERESWIPPAGDRWAIAAPGIDLSGKWKLIMTDRFRNDYDEFLRSLGQPIIVRGAAVVCIGNTREETQQSDGGRSLYVKGVNAKGVWERTLTSSGSDFDSTLEPNVDGSYTHTRVPIETAESERVVAESWWADDGTTHVSWTYGVTRYGGGSFESKRYLENDGNVYVCESTFHPDDSAGREKSYLKWKFLREGAAFMVTDK